MERAVPALDRGADERGRRHEQRGGQDGVQIAASVTAEVLRTVGAAEVRAAAGAVAEGSAVHTGTLGRGRAGRAAAGADVSVSSWFAAASRR